MWDDRSSVVSNVRTVKDELFRPATPATAIPPDDDFEEDLDLEHFSLEGTIARPGRR